jgi:hypothetical protein
MKLKKDIGILKKNQTEVLEMESSVSEIKTKIENLACRVEQVDGRKSKMKDRGIRSMSQRP